MFWRCVSLGNADYSTPINTFFKHSLTSFPSGHSLRVTAPVVIGGIPHNPRPPAVDVDIRRNGRQRPPRAFRKHALEQPLPQVTGSVVEPLRKALFYACIKFTRDSKSAEETLSGATPPRGHLGRTTGRAFRTSGRRDAGN
jgi:hypothetical protein